MACATLWALTGIQRRRNCGLQTMDATGSAMTSLQMNSITLPNLGCTLASPIATARTSLIRSLAPSARAAILSRPYSLSGHMWRPWGCAFTLAPCFLLRTAIRSSSPNTAPGIAARRLATALCGCGWRAIVRRSTRFSPLAGYRASRSGGVQWMSRLCLTAPSWSQTTTLERFIGSATSSNTTAKDSDAYTSRLSIHGHCRARIHQAGTPPECHQPDHWWGAHPWAQGHGEIYRSAGPGTFVARYRCGSRVSLWLRAHGRL